MNTGKAGRRALDRALHRVYDAKEGSRGVILSGRTDLVNFHDSVRRVTGRRPRTGEVQRLMREYLRCLPAEVRRSVKARTYKVAPGVEHLLEALNSRPDVRLGLGTGNMERGARIKLGPSGLNRFFRFGGFGSDAQDRARVLRLGARRSGVRFRGRDVVVIGDTPLDVQAGRKAGFRTVAVATGWDSPDDLRRAKPDRLMKDFKDLRSFLRWLGGKPSERKRGARK